MLSNQEKYLAYVSDVKNEVAKLSLADDIVENFSLQNLSKALRSTRLLIPVVGAFSAGKSTLLNKFMDNNYLQTAITPETSLATELHFNEEEYIEAIKKDESIDRFSLQDAENIKDKAKEYKYLKMYINNQKLKDIQPLVLVDMPGFESPLDLHNQAILEYLDKGAYYVILTSIEDGTITNSMFRQLDTIKSFGKDFSFFLSKCDLKPSSDIENVKEYIQEQIEDYLDISKTVATVSKENGEGFERVITQIDPENLFESLFLEILKDNYQNIHENINVLISAMKKSKDDNKKIIDELESSLRTLESKKDKMLEDAKKQYSNESIGSIINAIGADLSGHVEELVSVAINGGQDSLSNNISSIVSNSLLKNTKQRLGEISSNITNDFARELSHLNNSMSEITMSGDWLQKVSTGIETVLHRGVSALDEIVRKRKELPTNTNTLYKTITTILAITTNIAAPVVEVIAVFLPEIIGFFMKGIREKQQRNEIKLKILSEVIPSVKTKVREELTITFDEYIKATINDIADGFEGEINEKRTILENRQKENDENRQNIEQNIALHKEVNTNIQSLANKALY